MAGNVDTAASTGAKSDARSATSKAVNPCLAEAVQDAQIMLAYAAQRGKESGSDRRLKPDIIRTVVETSSRLEGGQLTDAHEAKFWVALDALATAIFPVSVTSLRATLDSCAGKSTFLWMRVGQRTLARRAVRIYTLIPVVTLILLLIAQIYWLFGSTVTADIQRTDKQLSDVSLRLSVQQKAIAAGSNLTQSQSKAALSTEQLNLKARKESSYRLLTVWSRPWEPAGQPRQARENSLDPKGNVARLETALIILDVFQRYILPLLYGLLGACVFVLRTLTAEIRERTYSEASNIGHRIRLYLGMLGGMVFAWFITPETADKLFQSLSPFALAFIAGYSVELLFAVMDRFLHAFTSTSRSQVTIPAGS